MIKKQFFGPLTWKILGGIALAHIAAFFLRESPLEGLALLAIFIATFWASRNSLLCGVVIAFCEIFVGGHGHLLDTQLLGISVSLRMTIFAGVIAAWLWSYWQDEITVKRDAWRELPFVLLTIALVAGFLQGVFANGVGAAFDDVNGYLILAYLLPIMSIDWTQTNKRALLQTLAASALWIVLFSLALLYIFTHVDGKALHVLYTFVRDSRLAEITLQVIDNKGSLPEVFVSRFGLGGESYYFYRVFMPSQSTAMMALLVSWGMMLFAYRGDRLPDFVGWIAVATFSVLFLSLSRSFFIGTFVAMTLMWLVALATESKRWITIRRSLWMAVCASTSIVIVYAIIVVPLPTRPDLTSAAFYETSASTGRGEAVVSRWALLEPLMDAIEENPLSGSGFGAMITYESSDPRIIEETGGVYSTYRFEWGWHDTWLKMGILGLLSFVVYLVVLTLSAHHHVKKHGRRWLVFSLLASVMALFVTHTFSPYLNHPIGIAWMLFVLPFFDIKGWGKTFEERFFPQRTFDRISQPVVTSQLAKKHSREN